MGKILRLEEIKLSEPLVDSLYDSDGKLLMQRGSMMTADKLKAFALKGLRYLELGAPSGETEANVSAVATLESPEAVEQWNGETPTEIAPVVTRSTTNPSIRPLDATKAETIAQLVGRASITVEELGKQLADGSLRDATPIRNVADEFLQELQSDSDQTIATALKQNADQQLAVRSVQLSVLSIAIARAMKMTVEEQATVGSAAMLHDMALFELPENERHSPELMRPESRRVYESHPAIAYDMLEKVRDIDGTVRIIVLQAHEQADGTGFPRRISITRTHRLARVVNLADAYLTLVGCGQGSQNIYPADAIAYLMHHSCQGRFDSVATCGLVRAVSLFPLGTLVRLSDNRTARVARAGGDNPLTPIVAVTERDGSQSMVDLAEASLSIERPLDDTEMGRRRLSASDIEKILW